MYPFLPHGGFQTFLQVCVCNGVINICRVSLTSAKPSPWSPHIHLGPLRWLQGTGEIVLVMVELLAP